MRSAYVKRLVQCKLEVKQYVVADVKGHLQISRCWNLYLAYDHLQYVPHIFFNMNGSRGGSDIIGSDIKKVIPLFQFGKHCWCRFHSCHCGIFRVWCNCRFISLAGFLASHFVLSPVIESLNYVNILQSFPKMLSQLQLH